MAIFGGGKSYLGIDIGTATLKVVQLSEKKGQPSLDTYGYTDFTNNLIHSDDPDEISRTAAVLRKILMKAKVTTNRAIMALPGMTVFSAVIEMPFIAEKDLASAVEFEARHYVPSPLEEVVLGWNVINEEIYKKFQKKGLVSSLLKKVPAEAPPEKIEVFLTAAPKKIVAKYEKILQILGLELSALETEFFPMSRALIGKDPTPAIIVDMGAAATNFNVMDQGYLRLNHGLDAGGDAIDEALMKAFKISKEMAVRYKIAYGVAATEKGKEVTDIIKPVVNLVANEIKRLSDLYYRKSKRKIEKIIIIGGTANLPGLTEYWANLLGVKTTIGDAFARVFYPKVLEPKIKEISPRMAVAVGLAMREIVE